MPVTTQQIFEYLFRQRKKEIKNARMLWQYLRVCAQQAYYYCSMFYYRSHVNLPFLTSSIRFNDVKSLRTFNLLSLCTKEQNSYIIYVIQGFVNELQIIPSRSPFWGAYLFELAGVFLLQPTPSDFILLDSKGLLSPITLTNLV
ncbi:hypothetical protein PHYBLDRAFT_68820 [Phycomyces blakesleeanus NRRL 1555(-)]|uniref:Uncharacterized protein n=1 Tax=Phycomyces blakesleeanus (strain ATCC 8743b / DSM 1359 / FGSC 10004 / NBRC 33097 / NRRL 1555) TaxID=763407 RepID=A0A167M5Y0_PHYB8|nr:hypothetical protein PHYBLDRAFT_68820 [Phycomyces blakesleeanus NRRL 1555(-)]OAD71897.1 hypothetical protein PHYBLDRAFT_68820 [Phycomyces blakesleeanus NRRL 1555(-)]|eukprot:XP_018289937.1 hypothetical protein PHYBLDRAFT_68820 [Phycomyces blakesleeanus NRRL 1555(-)]